MYCAYRWVHFHKILLLYGKNYYQTTVWGMRVKELKVEGDWREVFQQKSKHASCASYVKMTLKRV